MEAKSKYRLENVKLGEGSFSEVFLGTNVMTNQQVAIKKISLNQKNNVLEKLNLELNIIKKLNHPNIVTYYDVNKTDTHWFIIMEYCNAGTIENVIQYHEKMKDVINIEENAYYYLNQLKGALNYIRTVGYIHRDIKPMNVLLIKKLSDSELFFDYEDDVCSFDQEDYHHRQKLIVKLADFGLAKQYDPTDEKLMNSICGSPLYMSPELLLESKYNSSIDLWSFGIIMYELLFYCHPNSANSLTQLKRNLVSRDINFHLNHQYSQPCFDLLMKLLTKDYRNRIDWTSFFNHKWFVEWSSNFSGRLDCHTSLQLTSSSPLDSLATSRPSSLSLHNSPTGILGHSNLTKMSFIGYGLPCQAGKKKNYLEYPSTYPPSNVKTYNSNTRPTRETTAKETVKSSSATTKPIPIPSKSPECKTRLLNYDFKIINDYSPKIN